ncbi:hypothetical protein ACHWQZ_G016333 [Mnemiopsis leidyi]
MSVKGAIVTQDGKGSQWEFLSYDSLPKIISEALQKFNIEGNVDDWALMNEKTRRFVTEQNREEELHQGVVATIKRSPARLAEDSIHILTSKPDHEISLELENVVKYAEEFSYANEFYKKEGVTQLLDIVKRTPIFESMNCSILAHSLQALCLVMEYMGTELWTKILDNMAIKKLTEIVKSREAREKVLGVQDKIRTNTMSSTLTRNSSIRDFDMQNRDNKQAAGSENEPPMAQFALAAIDCVVRFTDAGFELISSLVKPSDVIMFITDTNIECAQYALALINALFAKQENKQQFYHELLDWNIRVNVEKVIRVVKPEHMDLSHHISEFQLLLLGLHKDAALKPVDPKEEDHMAMLERVKIQALSEHNGSEWSGLGFSSESADTAEGRAQDFQQCPPGLLALQCINHFVQKHYDRHREMVLDQLSREKDRQCPFIRSAVSVTGLLYQQLRIQRDYIGVEIDFLPVIFSQDNIFFELFSITVQLFNTTWHEMFAKTSDFNKVVDVVKEQLNMVFKGEKKISSTEDFKAALKAVPFSKIQEQRLKSLEKDSLPIIQLRKKLKPELQDLVNRQRLTILEAGEVFNVPKSNKRHRTLFCRLSSNHKTLHYGYDIANNDNPCPSIDELPEKLNVHDIEGIILWRDMKNKNRPRGWDSPLGFSLEYNQSTAMDAATKTLDFISQTVEVFSYWTDGINVLQKKDASNETAKQHLSMLLEMEIKIRQLDILDIEGLHLPENPPSIPPIPDNFNFHYNFN